MRSFLLVFFICSSFLFAQNYSSVVNSSIKELENNQFSAFHSKFSEQVKEQISITQVQTIWFSLNIQLGGLVAVHSYDSIIDNKGILFIVPIEFTKQWIDVKLHINDSLEIDGLFFTPGQKRYPYIIPSYADTALFSEMAIRIPVKDEFLSGFITLPRTTTNNVPILVLVHGSGPNDMDETVGPNKIFKDIAWGLASNGIAVVRYNKRTKELPHLIDANKITFKEEVTDDLKSVIAFMHTNNLELGIDLDQTYVLGHSLGGFLAPFMATENNIKGIILAGANARPLQDLIVDQVAYLSQLDGAFTDFEKREWEETKLKAKVISNNKFDVNTPASQMLLGLNANYWKALNSYSPTKTAVLLPPNVRILVLQGKRDYQVTFEKEFSLWQKALKKRKDTHFIAYPSLNHLFLPGEGASTPEEYENYAPFFEPALKDIILWIKN